MLCWLWASRCGSDVDAKVLSSRLQVQARHFLEKEESYPTTHLLTVRLWLCIVDMTSVMCFMSRAVSACVCVCGGVAHVLGSGSMCGRSGSMCGRSGSMCGRSGTMCGGSGTMCWGSSIMC